MSGILTNGLPAAPLPLTGLELIPIDTQRASGGQPESASITTQLLGTVGRGAVLVDTDGAIITMDASTGSFHSTTLGGNRTITIANPSPGQQVTIEVIQDGTGSRLVTWTNFLWAAGTPPTLSTPAGSVDYISATWNATRGKWIGFLTGKAFA